jgi:uncharacterized protein YndB with AHSA1/START domain
VLNTLGIVAIVVVALIACLLLFAVTRPASFTVNRSIAIKAPADRIFALIQDLHRWAAWSPWENKDPAMKRTFGGAPAGLGAVYEWTGNKNVGQGRMEIVEIKAPEKVVIKLDFLKPFEAHNMAEFTLLPTSDTITVTWSMYGPSPYIAKVMGMFVSMDKMVGKDFDAGLVNLKAQAEK